MSRRRDTKFDVVQVLFEDPQIYSGWHDGPDADKADAALCSAAGYLIRDDKEFVTVAVTLGLDRKTHAPDQANGIFCIPRGCVKQMRTLKRALRDRTPRRQSR